jgi:CRISPR/Cas system-associated protein Cas5 (RAMP superfamily)
MSDCRRRYVSLLVRGGFCLLLGNYKRNNESFKYNFEILIVGVRLEERMVDVYNKYSDVLSNMSPEEQQKNMDKAYEMMSLFEEIQGLEYELNQLDASPSQMKRLMKAVEKLEVLN